MSILFSLRIKDKPYFSGDADTVGILDPALEVILLRPYIRDVRERQAQGDGSRDDAHRPTM